MPFPLGWADHYALRSPQLVEQAIKNQGCTIHLFQMKAIHNCDTVPSFDENIVQRRHDMDDLGNMFLPAIGYTGIYYCRYIYINIYRILQNNHQIYSLFHSPFR